MHNIFIRLTFLSFLSLLLSCSNKGTDIEPVRPIDPKQDKWTTEKLVDSVGNHYFMAATYDSKLEVRVEDAQGTLIFSAVCTKIDSTEIPLTADSAIVVLAAPNRFINIHDASLSIVLYRNKRDYNHVQLIANLSLDTKKFYTKKYKVEEPLDWSFVYSRGAVAQWYESTILVREGEQQYLNGGGYLGLGSRGKHLVCYERDFSIRFRKNIDVTAAYYPSSGGEYIPVNSTEAIGCWKFDGVITKIAIFVSVVDEWAGVKPIVWQVDLKEMLHLPVGNQLHITYYSVQGNLVKTTFTVYDKAGTYLWTKSVDLDLKTGTPIWK